MPYKCTGPISRKLADGSRVSLKRGDSVTDELAAELKGTHKHALTRVPHTSHNCKTSCGHHSHPWNQQAQQKTAAPVTATVTPRRVPDTAATEVKS